MHKHSHRAQHGVFVARKSCLVLGAAPEAAEQTFQAQGKTPPVTKIMDHKMVLQENIFPSVILISREVY